MDIDHKRHLTFALRLPSSLRESANDLARKDGISLNHFISLAVAEKISRLERYVALDRPSASPQPRPVAINAIQMKQRIYS